MPTEKQKLGALGEALVAKSCDCPRCKRSRTLKRLPANFKCADVVCDFCGYLAQVKTSNVRDTGRLPRRVTGAAWRPQKERMDSGIYFPLFLVLVSGRKRGIYYLPSDLQLPSMFKKRKPLSKTAKRKGWQGFEYQFESLEEGSFLRLQ